MKKHSSLLFIILILWLNNSFGQTNTSQSVLKGVVIDSWEQPIYGANVFVKQGSDVIKQAQTDSTGMFELSIPSGNYTLEVHFIGKEPIKISIEVSQAQFPFQKIVLKEPQIADIKGWKINYFPKFENWHTLFFYENSII